jgi:hypothetical protein
MVSCDPAPNELVGLVLPKEKISHLIHNALKTLVKVGSWEARFVEREKISIFPKS